MVKTMPTTTPMKAPASATSFELNASPTNQSPAIAKRNTGIAARCARPHGTLTWRVQFTQRIVRFGPRVCFCQKEKLLWLHQGHSYIGTPEWRWNRPRWIADVVVILSRV